LLVIQPRNSGLPDFKTGLILYTRTDVTLDTGGTIVSVEESCSNEFYTGSQLDLRWKVAVALQTVGE